MVADGQTHPHVEWLGTCGYTADALSAAGMEQPAGAVEEAMAWLEETLADGPLPSAEVRRLAEEEGISPKSLRTARERVRKKPSRDDKTKRTVWALGQPAAGVRDNLEKTKNLVERMIEEASGGSAQHAQHARYQEWARRAC
jgi:hypothetical protein